MMHVRRPTYRDIEVINAQGASCSAELCSNCPRSLGTQAVKGAGLSSLWRGPQNRVVDADPLTSREITGYKTNGCDGVFVGDDGTTGVVRNLRGETVAGFVRAVVRCQGPDKAGACGALGERLDNTNTSLAADLNSSVTRMLEPLVIEVSMLSQER